ncbi:TBC1 domain family member 5 like protein [Argiope bruennichi]|uniref:TBC1 domain family member 5 like protein n=1 Tax=Argiope bruennichi TaxID=94029 RepID=A0A8T0FKJ9_ARGBR|nr:TBC1 domain family member 5 like protein [Argiope bruennichi]
MVTRAMEASNSSISDFNPFQCDEVTSPYEEEWESLFSGVGYLNRLKSSAIKGKLQASHFRSVCWKLFLRCLPENRQLWIETVKSQRQHYEEIMDKFDTNPRNVNSLDVTVNNPLSQSQQNPWNQYFMDAELKVTIHQDVVRTFPEIEFFHTPNIQKMMCNILFSYAREFPHVSYKQGMHELLAPIIFVLHYDQQAYLQASEIDSLDLEIHILLNQNYIEHDAFFMFCQLMDSVEPWYTMTDYSHSKYAKQIATEPFSQSIVAPGNLLGRKLKRIYEQLLKHHDLTLFSYFEQLEITPQIFGIRWLRLLFGREFTIHDLLIVWDAIFADSITFHLVDYIFVAMLISIRDLLLKGDYATCLSHLMRFPNVVDAHYIVDLALHLREPDRIKMPERKIVNPLQLRASKDSKRAENKSVSKNSYPGIAKPVKSQTISNKAIETRPKSLSISSVNVLRSNSTESSPTNMDSARTKSSSLSERNSNAPSSDPDEVSCSEFLDSSVSYTESKGASFTLPRTRIRNVMENRNHKFRPSDITQSLGNYNEKSSSSEATFREMVPLVPSSSNQTLTHVEYLSKRECKPTLKEANEEIKVLKSKISELKLMNEYCTEEITQHLEKLQESMVNQKLQHEDEMFIALAGIKRVRDILKGTVSFTEEVLGDNLIPYCVSSPGSSKLYKDISVVEKTEIKNANIPCSKISANNVIDEVSADESFQIIDVNTELFDSYASTSVIDAFSSHSTQESNFLDSFNESLNFETYSRS